LKSWGKSWWNRQQIAREIKRLNALKKDCQEQFTVRKRLGISDWTRSKNYQLFCAARTEGKADQIVETTVQINNTTARIEAADVRIADTTTRIEAETGQIASTAARIEDGTALIADTTAQIQTDIVQVASTAARIEDGTVLLTDTTARIEQTTDQVQILA
jgi:methyl-accepting chemotaxis protein